jgi:hypothetical protein
VGDDGKGEGGGESVVMAEGLLVRGERGKAGPSIACLMTLLCTSFGVAFVGDNACQMQDIAS